MSHFETIMNWAKCHPCLTLIITALGIKGVKDLGTSAINAFDHVGVACAGAVSDIGSAVASSSIGLAHKAIDKGYGVQIPNRIDIAPRSDHQST